MKNGKESLGEFKQIKDLHFPKGCGNIEKTLIPNNKQITISPLARSFSLPFNYDAVESHISSASDDVGQTVKRQVAEALNSDRRKTGRKNDGFYYPDYSGR